MPRSSRFKGLPYLLVREYGLMMLLGVGLAAILGLVIIVLSRMAESPGAVADLVQAELLLLDGAGAPAVESAEFLAAMLWATFFFASVSARFPSLTRHLRVLPIGGARLNAMLVAWPALIWVTVWLLVVALRYLVIGRGATWLSVALIVVMTGLSALVQALMLRLPMLRTLVLPAAFLAVLLVRVSIAPSSVELALLGAAALGAAAVINHSSLGRNATYRNRPIIFGVPLPPSPL